MFAGSVTGGIPGSGRDRSAGPATGQRAATARAAGGECGAGLACDAAAAGAWARAWWLVSAFSRETTAMTAIAATTARQAQPNQIRHRANRFARLPGLRMSVHIPH